MANTPARGGGTPLDPKLADRLLDLLSSDNAFRRQFKKDPQAALASLGYRATTTKACASVKAIAPKQEIAASRDALRTQMLAAGIFSVPHCFEAGKVASSLRRK
ncbi:MAG TPA: NHLP-related RiPP peptide [Xanthomonadaceae bacterium]|nr:NHLP-related RiPP peptide [Xanthomonadaceae bacterium]